MESRVYRMTYLDKAIRDLSAIWKSDTGSDDADVVHGSRAASHRQGLTDSLLDAGLLNQSVREPEVAWCPACLYLLPS